VSYRPPAPPGRGAPAEGHQEDTASQPPV